jgi:hypothetical protein
VLLLAWVAFLWTPTGQLHVKATLLLLQALPQVPVKPLTVLSNAPVHQRIELASPHGPIVADLFRPVPRFGTIQPHTKPALVLALGVRTKPRDRTLVLSFAQTMSRLGYVVLWPRLQALDRGMPLLESPETFVLGMRYLKGVDLVDHHRITIFGFSVGASLALVAATNQQIAKEVHALVFFGGYYDIFSYLTSLATQTSSIDGKTVAWPGVLDALGGAARRGRPDANGSGSGRDRASARVAEPATATVRRRGWPGRASCECCAGRPCPAAA